MHVSLPVPVLLVVHDTDHVPPPLSSLQGKQSSPRPSVEGNDANLRRRGGVGVTRRHLRYRLTGSRTSGQFRAQTAVALVVRAMIVSTTLVVRGSSCSAGYYYPNVPFYDCYPCSAGWWSTGIEVLEADEDGSRGTLKMV